MIGLLTMHHHMSAYFGAEDPVESEGWTNSKPSFVPAFHNASRAETVLGLNLFFLLLLLELI